MSTPGGSDNDWRQLRRSLLHAAARFTAGTVDAEDLVQASFERFWQMRPELHTAEAHAPLLHTIMRRLAIDRARKLRRWRFDELSDAREYALPDGTLELAQAPTVKLNEALAQLAPEDRALLRLRHEQNLRYHAIARQLGVPPGTVATRLRRIRSQLRTLLGTAPVE